VNPGSQNPDQRYKAGWWSGSGGETPAQKAQDAEFKPQYSQKRKKAVTLSLSSFVNTQGNLFC
jgi:hypothetical protein